MPSLPAGIKGSAYLGSAKGTVGEQASVFTGKGHALGHTLVNNVYTVLGKAVNICLPGTEVPPFDGIVKEPVDTVPVILVILCPIDSALCRNGVCPSWGILITKAIHIVSKFAKGGRGRTARQSGTHHNDLELSLVRRIDQLGRKTMIFPLVGKWTFWDLGIEIHGAESLQVDGAGRTTGGLETIDQAILLGDHQYRNDGKAGKNYPPISGGSQVEFCPPALRAQTEGLKHTGYSMGEVAAQKKHAKYIEAGDGIDPEASKDHRVDIMYF